MERMKKRNGPVNVFLLLSVLCGSMFLTAPLYDECADPYPDEWLDLFGIAQDPVSLGTLAPRTAASSVPDPIPSVRAFPGYHAEECSVHQLASELLLSVALRC